MTTTHPRLPAYHTTVADRIRIAQLAPQARDRWLAVGARWTVTKTPIGDMLLAGTDEALHHVLLPPSLAKVASGLDSKKRGRPASVDAAIAQIKEYFSGRRTSFELPLDPKGTSFQREVWFALGEIPYGETTTYGAIAARVGRPEACRAVGRTNGNNPLPIVLPCHRVIGANGTLTGYGGGIELKKYLLDHEQAVLARGNGHGGGSGRGPGPGPGLSGQASSASR